MDFLKKQAMVFALSTPPLTVQDIERAENEAIIQKIMSQQNIKSFHKLISLQPINVHLNTL